MAKLLQKHAMKRRKRFRRTYSDKLATSISLKKYLLPVSDPKKKT